MSTFIQFMALFFLTASGNNYSNQQEIISFKIVWNIQPNKFCAWTKYTLTNGTITIEKAHPINHITEPAGLDQTKCISKTVYQKNLSTSKKLFRLSQISFDQWEAIPADTCAGNISHTISINKEDKIKEITYCCCAKDLDENTKMILRYINSQVPKKYKIDL